MKRLYDICGITVECDFRYPLITGRAEKYLCDNPSASPVIRIPYSPEDIERLRASQPHLSAEDCEMNCTARAFYLSLLYLGGFMLHSSAVAVDNSCYLFSAPSGTGKSTHTGLWLELFGKRARIINDDKPAIMVKDGVITACGTPWSGKDDLSANEQVPLRGICVLGRSEKNYITRISCDEALYHLLDQTLRPRDEKSMSKLLELLDTVTGIIPVWRMGCDISLEAAEMAFNTMSG